MTCLGADGRNQFRDLVGMLIGATLETQRSYRYRFRNTEETIAPKRVRMGRVRVIITEQKPDPDVDRMTGLE